MLFYHNNNNNVSVDNCNNNDRPKKTQDAKLELGNAKDPLSPPPPS